MGTWEDIRKIKCVYHSPFFRVIVIWISHYFFQYHRLYCHAFQIPFGVITFYLCRIWWEKKWARIFSKRSTSNCLIFKVSFQFGARQGAQKSAVRTCRFFFTSVFYYIYLCYTSQNKGSLSALLSANKLANTYLTFFADFSYNKNRVWCHFFISCYVLYFFP